jgi:hypothetical protein
VALVIESANKHKLVKYNRNECGAIRVSGNAIKGIDVREPERF